jgi:PAS domain S-box-containing protein
LPVAVETLQKASRGETQPPYELRVLSKSGQYLVGEFTSTPHVKDGKVVGELGIARDITERKRAEEALRESEERFRGLVENATVGIYRTTPEGRILMANAALVRMLGYESFQALATRDLEQEGFEPTYPRSAFRERVDREGEITGLEAAWKRRDGSVIHVRESARAVRASDGRVLYYDGIVEDVTERHRAEEALRHQNEMQQTILDSIPVMIVFLDRESRHHLVNRCWQSTLGWSLEEVQHKDILAEIYPDPAYRKYVQDYVAAATGTWGDFKSRTRDGRMLDTSWANVPLSDGSNIGIGIDITERHRAEQALRESQEMFQKAFQASPDTMVFHSL